MIEVVLNRLRGTGDIFSVGNFKVTGTMIYAVYLLIVSALLIFNINSTVNDIVAALILSFIGIVGYDLLATNLFYSLSVVVLFLAGESYAFGKWVGYLVDYENEHKPEYDSKVGKGFPYIHYIAEAIVSEKVNYERYCQVALAIRGLMWWMPVYVVLGFAGVVSWLGVMIASVILAIGFPVACKIGREWKYDARFGVLRFKRGWENQEIVYGAIQGLCLWYVIIIQIVK